ncbi:pYEATS domain-containing protein [Sinorhizobium meliloti]|uniref:pYEATS domain-containing protein n=1 Tax=Rhizobium meliloti TaxID=382 RepID=UPI00299EB4A7|nr:hypothetical protein [Sinorhizobium meliloti]MDW9620951.1 hypothetical protein [Sinorhizobium meliloti]MDX0154705.1 hypothetical protein [Sinorhizobium meliloti]
MTNKLYVKAPTDMSIGRIRIIGQGNQVGEWLATPTKATSQFDVPAGPYAASIEPLGQLARNFAFIVREGETTEVQIPTLRQLAAGGEVFLNSNWNANLNLDNFPTTVIGGADESETNRPSRWLSIAISQDTLPGRIGGWRPYSSSPQPVLTISGDLVEIAVERPHPALHREHSRLRLECAVSGLRNERLMLPLFRGGTKVVIRSNPTSSDVIVIVFPVDMRSRALVQALYAGSVAETQQVALEQLEYLGNPQLDLDEPDPWMEIANALVLLRFPELERNLSEEEVGLLVARSDWIPDAHAIWARHQIDTASEADEQAAGVRALNAIAKCRQLGMPYFAYTAQIVSDILNALSKPFEESPLSVAAKAELNKWQLRIPAQKNAGAIFSWLVTGSKTQPSIGRIDERFSKILFRGRLDPGRFWVQNATGKTPKSGKFTSSPEEVPLYSDDGVLIPTSDHAGDVILKTEPVTRLRQDPEALSLQIMEQNDPHKGRWGGVASKDGYLLSAEFVPTTGTRSWVTVVLSVEADPDLISSSYDEPVEFFLHPTFHPDRVRTVFRGYKARLELGCYGGFTVGAWLPGPGIELELDLSELKDAPHIIKNF